MTYYQDRKWNTSTAANRQNKQPQQRKQLPATNKRDFCPLPKQHRQTGLNHRPLEPETAPNRQHTKNRPTLLSHQAHLRIPTPFIKKHVGIFKRVRHHLQDRTLIWSTNSTTSVFFALKILSFLAFQILQIVACHISFNPLAIFLFDCPACQHA